MEDKLKNLGFAMIISAILAGVPGIYLILNYISDSEKLLAKSLPSQQIIFLFLDLMLAYCFVTVLAYFFVKEYRGNRSIGSALHKMLFVRAQIRISFILYGGIFCIFCTVFHILTESLFFSVFLGIVVSFPFGYLIYKKSRDRKRWIEEERRKLDAERNRSYVLYKKD